MSSCGLSPDLDNLRRPAGACVIPFFTIFDPEDGGEERAVLLLGRQDGRLVALGGRCKPGEDSALAAAREALEESAGCLARRDHDRSPGVLAEALAWCNRIALDDSTGTFDVYLLPMAPDPCLPQKFQLRRRELELARRIRRTARGHMETLTGAVCDRCMHTACSLGRALKTHRLLSMQRRRTGLVAKTGDGDAVVEWSVALHDAPSAVQRALTSLMASFVTCKGATAASEVRDVLHPDAVHVVPAGVPLVFGSGKKGGAGPSKGWANMHEMVELDELCFVRCDEAAREGANPAVREAARAVHGWAASRTGLVA